MVSGTTVEYLEQSLVYAEHASRSDVTVDDIKLAVQSKVNADFSGPPTRETMAEMASERNKEPLPIIAEKFGVRLPSSKHCLTQPNYRVVGKMGDPSNAKHRSQQSNQLTPSQQQHAVHQSSLDQRQPTQSTPLMALPSSSRSGGPTAASPDNMDEDDYYD